MKVKCIARVDFAKMIRYFHSKSCELVVFTQRIEEFVNKKRNVRYIVVKDKNGIAAAYIYDDMIVIQEEK